MYVLCVCVFAKTFSFRKDLKIVYCTFMVERSSAFRMRRVFAELSLLLRAILSSILLEKSVSQHFDNGENVVCNRNNVMFLFQKHCVNHIKLNVHVILR